MSVSTVYCYFIWLVINTASVVCPNCPIRFIYGFFSRLTDNRINCTVKGTADLPVINRLNFFFHKYISLLKFFFSGHNKFYPELNREAEELIRLTTLY